MNDKDERIIEKYGNKLRLELFRYLYEQGEGFVNQNYYDIQTFIKLLLNDEFFWFVLQLGTTYNFNPRTKLPVKIRKDISSIGFRTIQKYSPKMRIPQNFRLFLSYFVNSNTDIVDTFKYFLSKRSNEINNAPSLEQIIIDSRTYKTQLIVEKDIAHEPKGLILKIFGNTKTNNLVKFLNLKETTRTIKSIQSLNKLPYYPHGKLGKVGYYQKIKEYLSEKGKKQAKIKNRAVRKKVGDNNSQVANYEYELLPDTDEQIAAKALGDNKYYKRKYSKSGANLLRQRRKRLKDKLKSV